LATTTQVQDRLIVVVSSEPTETPCALPFTIQGNTATLQAGATCYAQGGFGEVNGNLTPIAATSTYLSGTATLDGGLLTLTWSDVWALPALAPGGVPSTAPDNPDQVETIQTTVWLERYQPGSDAGFYLGPCSCSLGSGCAGCLAGGICDLGAPTDAGEWQGPCVMPRYTVNGDAGTVLDDVTGLVWQQSAPTELYGWLETPDAGSAADYCQQLGLGGGGWRVPTLPELFSLAQSASGIDPAFSQIGDGDFWTSTLSADGGQAWAVLFAVGAGDTTPLSIGETASIRCVR
jgi:hypothetical protein